MIDENDRRLLRALQRDPDLTTSALASQTGMSAGMTARRLARLRDTAILRGIRARIDWRALGYSVEVSLRIRLDKDRPRAFDDVIAAAREISEVIEIQTFLGRVDLRLKVIARDLEHYQHIYRDRILALPHLADIEALMHVATVKLDERLPL